MKNYFQQLEDYIKNFDPEIEVVPYDRWASDMVEKAVYIGPELSEEDKRMSLHGYEALGMEVKCDPTLFALFHEIGHVVTAGKLSKPEREKLLEDYIANLNILMEDRELTDEEFIEAYWKIKAEQMANHWAVSELSCYHDIEINALQNILNGALASEEMDNANPLMGFELLMGDN